MNRRDLRDTLMQISLYLRVGRVPSILYFGIAVIKSNIKMIIMLYNAQVELFKSVVTL